MELLTKQIIEYEEALLLSTKPEDFAIRYSGISRQDNKKWADNSVYQAKVADAWSGLSDVDLEVTALTKKTLRNKTKKIK